MFKKLKKFLATALITTVLATGFNFVVDDNVGIKTAFAANTHSIDLEASSSQYLSITDSNLSSGFPGKLTTGSTGDITVEAWVKFESLPSAGSSMTILSKDDPDSGLNDRSFVFFINTSDKLIFTYSDSGNTSSQTANISDNAIVTSGELGTWMHLAAVVDVSAGTVVMYKNASSIGVTNLSNAATSIILASAPFQIGVQDIAGSGRFYFDGLIDEARVWSDIRTPTEISNNYNIETTDTSNLEGYWQLNNALTDASGNSNTLTNNNTAVFSTSVPFSSSSITLTDITDLKVYQQDSSNQGSITVAGTYTGTPTSIQARVVRDGTSTEVKTWTTIDASPTGGTFSASLSTIDATDFWYNLEVRFGNDTGVTDEGTNQWGIGDLIFFGGQSLSTRMFTQGSTLTPNAKVVKYDGTWANATGDGAVQIGNALHTERGVPIGLLDYGVSGASLVSAAADPAGNYWLNTDASSPWDLAKTGVSNATDGNKIIALIIFQQGERDGLQGTSQATYYAGLGTLFDDQFRTEWSAPSGTLKIVESVLGRRTDATDANMQGVRSAIIQKINADENVLYGDSHFDLALVDSVHPTDAEMPTLGERLGQSANFAFGEVTYHRGQNISSYSQISSSIFDINLATVTGITDFTPTSAITGFSILDDAAAETISTAVQVDANTIRLTIAGTITGIPTVRYLYGANPTVTSPVKGNDTLTLPLESNASIDEQTSDLLNSVFFGITF